MFLEIVLAAEQLIRWKRRFFFKLYIYFQLLFQHLYLIKAANSNTKVFMIFYAFELTRANVWPILKICLFHTIVILVSNRSVFFLKSKDNQSQIVYKYHNKKVASDPLDAHINRVYK